MKREDKLTITGFSKSHLKYSLMINNNNDKTSTFIFTLSNR
ncbi:hypothetical protein J3D55_002397 [Chryseobacterium ginsenosidimutans]|nr:hypothetical protein [Chryseobacterium ginsenosidimutans]